MITVVSALADAELAPVFAIRREVFVEEQHVPADEEFDEYETSSRHFLALLHGQPVGTARWRRTDKGVKLERFAVSAAARGHGVGKALVQAVLADVFARQPAPPGAIYLHAQLTAMPLYAGFGFVAIGPLFDECGIMHTKMVLPVEQLAGNSLADPQLAGSQ